MCKNFFTGNLKAQCVRIMAETVTIDCINWKLSLKFLPPLQSVTESGPERTKFSTTCIQSRGLCIYKFLMLNWIWIEIRSKSLVKVPDSGWWVMTAKTVFTGLLWLDFVLKTCYVVVWEVTPVVLLVLCLYLSGINLASLFGRFF